MSDQEVIIKIDGISQATVLAFLEAHSDITYRYKNKNNEPVEIKIVRVSDIDYDVSFKLERPEGKYVSTDKFETVSKALDEFFKLIKQNPA